MFTVCPKCALTLVVTAADLRVAQGYVRCGRCSNVFNALARLSEDRQAAAAQAQSSPEPAPPAKAPSPSQQPPRPAADPAPTATPKAAQPPPSPAPPPEPKRYDDNSIPEEDLEFNPDATDLNEVFVKQSPDPKFTAATGTFRALRLGAEDAARAEERRARNDERKTPEDEPFDPLDTQVDVEIDPELLATMAQLTSNRLERLNPTLPEPGPAAGLSEEPPPAAPLASPYSTGATGALTALAAPKAAPPAKQFPLQSPMEQPPQPPAPMRLAERAKARASAARATPGHAAGEPARAGPNTTRPSAGPESDPATKSAPAPSQQPAAAPGADAKRASAFETAQALRAALLPRKRSAAHDTHPASNEKPTLSFGGPWAAGSALLLLVLVIQVVHHYRHDLAANATLNGPLTSIYAALGVPIVPRWDVGAYEVRQLGASTAAEAPGRITVRASVKNTAHQDQPLPLLRVTLQDRFGNRIASRDVPPQSYLPRAMPGSSLLPAGERIDAEMAFVDPGSNAVGFEIDACLPAPGGISCANDTTR